MGGLAATIPILLGKLGGVGAIFLFMLGGAVFAYPCLLVAGVPLFLLTRRFGATQLWLYLAIGALFAALGWLVASSPVPSSEFRGRAVAEGIFALASGLVGAATFWAMAVRESGT
jgi:hypothetical protein